ncbi:MAG: hypothetical protein HYZ36_06420, partial [Pedosphaera parvula]|nr:hypothetical protein [Pedosphaera parvula]
RYANEQGNALVMTLFAVMIIGFSMASYLDLAKNQNFSVARSQQWNTAIPVIEAGLEEALTHLYYSGTNLGGNGWQLEDGLYHKERFLYGQSNKVVGKYKVSISPDAKPVIISRAYLRGKESLMAAAFERPRAVQVTVTNAPMFAKGMVAKGAIDLSGNNVRTDSFDSADPLYNSGGLYDPVKKKDNGDVATNSGRTNSFKVGNANIYGRASTGPGGSIDIGPNGAVGSIQWQESGRKGIEPGWSSDDMNVQFPDVNAPFSGGAITPAGGRVNGTNYAYVLGSGNYKLSSLSMSGQQKVLVSGNAVLYVTGSISMAGQASIDILTNATLMLYVGGSSADLGGNGVINSSSKAERFYYYGLPSNTSLSLRGNAAFSGVIYA